MKKTTLLITTAWAVLVGISFLWNYWNAAHERERIAFETGRSFFRQLVIMREWNAKHGGVYVPITETTQPNPYVEDPLRDIQVNDTLRLTRINPAFMTRQLSEIAEAHNGVKFHITSLNPLRPDNRATEWEAQALKAFEKGIPEAGEFINDEPQIAFRYMAPLVTDEACLKCHAKQGYQVGDIRGGIRIDLPDVPAVQWAPLALGHLGIGLTGMLLILRLERKLEKAYESLRQQAVMDTLTGIPNRRYFTERIIQEFKRCKRERLPLSIVICDIDYFKRYNDTYGHKAGDECLTQVAGAIQSSIRRPVDFCARYGGEEFIVVLPNTPKAGAAQMAERVRTKVESLQIAHEASEHSVVTLSLGLETADSENTSYEDVIKRADAALYKAKANGRNRVEVA